MTNFNLIQIFYFQADQDDHVTKADVEKARVNKEQKRTLAEDAKNEYARALVKCNEQQRTHHTKLVPNILSRYQRNGSNFLFSANSNGTDTVSFWTKVRCNVIFLLQFFFAETDKTEQIFNDFSSLSYTKYWGTDVSIKKIGQNSSKRTKLVTK